MQKLNIYRLPIMVFTVLIKCQFAYCGLYSFDQM